MAGDSTARPAAGTAGGALTGQYPEPGFGVPPITGYGLWEEYIATPASGVGDLAWPTHTVGGTAPSYPVDAPVADTEFGIRGITTGTGSSENDGGTIAMDDAGSASLYRAPAAGAIWMAKLRALDTTNIIVWSGFAEDNQIIPKAATATAFIGIRALSVGSAGNYFGVVKNTAGTESTVDLSIACNTTWRILGFEVLGAGTIQFFSMDASDAMHLIRTDIGAAVAVTNKPDTELVALALGVAAGVGGGAKKAVSDFWGLGGRVAR